MEIRRTVAAVFCVLWGGEAADAAMNPSVREVLNFPNRFILGVAEAIGPATHSAAVNFLNSADGNMRYFAGGFVYLLILCGVITPHFWIVTATGGDRRVE
ncbi:MAG: hypothetical protein LBT65_08155 [Synergistaceae bacterium]|jgi:hypothetical protein|nr:hypothetical protein [Synergistaceae bacterium]